ncbi:MAG: MgtC/SapB family protein [Phycisphaerales bacterium]
MDSTVQSLGIALGLGLLVGLQREHAGSKLAGIRTFPLVALLGAASALLAERFGGWTIGAGLIALAATLAMGNAILLRQDPARDAGITTEVAVLAMFGIGALTVVQPPVIVLGLGVAVAALLHSKGRLHGLAARVGEADIRAILLFAAIAFVILPVLPDKGYGPYAALNPRQIWQVVVLVSGISLAGYVALKLLGARAGALLAGVLGGLVSSTATTAAAARRVRGGGAVTTACLMIALSSAIVFPRVFFLIWLTDKPLALEAASPLAVVFLTAICAAGVMLVRAQPGPSERGEHENPAGLRGALVFAGLYAIVLLGVAFGRDVAGAQGLYVVAILSGLTDMDAITLSTAKLAAADTVSSATATRAILLAAMANMAFKAGLAGVLGGRRLLLPVLAIMGALLLAAGAGLWIIAG